MAGGSRRRAEPTQGRGGTETGGLCRDPQRASGGAEGFPTRANPVGKWSNFSKRGPGLMELKGTLAFQDGFASPVATFFQIS